MRLVEGSVGALPRLPATLQGTCKTRPETLANKPGTLRGIYQLQLVCVDGIQISLFAEAGGVRKSLLRKSFLTPPG